MLLSTADSHEQLDPAEVLMREIGEQLRQVRLERGEELGQISEYLRIRPAYLHAIEQGDMAALPGRVYALGFLRTYAEYLGFNGNELISRIRNVVDSLTDRSRLRVRTPLPESRLPKTPVLVLSLGLVAGVYGGWIYLHNDGAAVVEPVSEVPDELRELAQGGLRPPTSEGARSAEAAAPGDVPPRAFGSDAGAVARPVEPPLLREAGTGRLAALPEPGVEEAANGRRAPTRSTIAAAVEDGFDAAAANAGAPIAAAPLRATDDRAGAGLELQVGPLPEPDAAAAPDSEADEDPQETSAPSAGDVLAALDARFADGGEGAPRVHEAGNADARVILRARTTSWVQISSADAGYTEAATLLPGEVFLVPNRSDLTLWTGNAGGLEVLVDGEPVAPLGPEGAVMRRVSLDPSALLARAGAE